MDASSSSTITAATAAGPLSPALDISGSISERTSSKNALHRTYLDGIGDPPTTPLPTRRRKKDKGKEPVSGQGVRREQLRREHNDQLRHSHGLSWSSTTRDSVVDNLLLSLDGLAVADLPGGVNEGPERAIEREKYGLPPMPDLPQFPASRPMQRARGHTYSSSLSSGADGYGVTGVPSTPSSKYSSTKGRRSNSSSNFGTITSKTRRPNGPGRISSDTQRHIGDALHVKSAGGDVDSMENGYGRLNFGGRRSMSMDQIYTEQGMLGASILERGRPVPSVHSKFETNYDAAPEPGVPAGPRKKLNPMATGPVYVNQAPSKQSIRKVNTQSDLRAVSQCTPPIPQHIQVQASDFVRNNSMRGVPSMSLPHAHSAPAPSPGFMTARKDAPSPHRERPGFFKRVFGHASRTPSGMSTGSQEAFSYGDLIAPPVRTQSQASRDTTSQVRPGTRKTSREQSQTSYPPPTLNKKPSSFFRRRKKSDFDNAPPPPLPLNPTVNLNVKPAEPSPSVSSLRKVMDPYLALNGVPAHRNAGSKPSNLTRPTTQESTTEDSDEISIFHSGYTPPPDASLGWRDPLRRDGQARPKQSQETQDSPKMKIKKKRAPDDVQPTGQHSQDPAQISFLYDTSREVSTATIGEHFVPPTEQPKVSPLTEVPPVTTASESNCERPVSRPSTGDRILAWQPSSPVEDATRELRNLSESTHISTDAEDDSWVVLQPLPRASQDRPESKKSNRLFLKPTEQEETRSNDLEPLSPLLDSRDASRSGSLQSPTLFTAATSIAHSPGLSTSVYHSANSLPLPSVFVDSFPQKSGETQLARGPSVLAEEGAEYTERARKIFDGDEEDVLRGEAASWLGERNTLSTKTLHAYMQLFDFSGKNLLAALRALCDKLLLKGETQQVDRIITALSERWCSCNPNHGFKAQDVVHTIFYSLILLNTDLHMADIGEKMSRSAYVKNTLPTIRRVVADAAPNAFDDTIKPTLNVSRPPLPWQDTTALAPPSSNPTSPSFPPPDALPERTSFENQRPNASKRLSLRPGMFRSESDGWVPDSAGGSSSNALVNQSWSGPMRSWELEVEMVLKSFFASIRSEPLPLLGAPAAEYPAERNLSVANMTGLKRSGSVVSKAPSDVASYRTKPGLRAMTIGWHNRQNRSRPKLYPASTVASSRTSFDDNNSMWSPAQSSNWSKNSFARTLTSASMNSLGHHLSPTAADYKHSIGFANALSQAIIREEGGGTMDDGESLSVPGGLLEDEALTLEGAPWAKEGLVKHKHHLETVDRKAKERSWTDCFAVISKGKLTLFSFNTSSKSHSMSRKNHSNNNKSSGGRAASLAATKVGGGDWMENAEELESFILRHTIASTLPPPGYSKARPHVWALSLPSGAVHLFQVGTPEIAIEFMTSANYWSARLSKEPLSGSVSNIEYGWSDQVINPALTERSESFTASPPPSSMANVVGGRGHLHSSSSASGPLPRPSFQSSMRGSFDTGFGGGSGGRGRLPGDKVYVTDWQPPQQSMMASQLVEGEQLKGLTAYVGGVEVELERHNELKHAIELAYSPRHANHNRSMTNWQRKSEYLLREIVKFRTYMDSLAAAQQAKDRFYASKAGQDAASKRGVSPVDSGRPDVTPRPPQTAG